MTIAEFSSGSERGLLAIVGGGRERSSLAPLLPEFAIETIEPQTSDATTWLDAPDLDAVVFLQSPRKPRQVTRDIESLAPLLLARGCPLFVAPLSASTLLDPLIYLRQIVDTLDRTQLPTTSGIGPALRAERFSSDWAESLELTPLNPCVHVLQADRWERELAEVLRRNRRGPRPNVALNPDVRGKSGEPITLTAEELLLVRRAFHDCHRVRLARLEDGLSGVAAYRAYIERGSSPAGRRWPESLFVKIGRRAKVACELRAFSSFSLDSVPYHLGPRIKRERCELGHMHGILVSDFVSDAETLKTAARGGRGHSAIAPLFGATLESWRMNSSEERIVLKEILRQRACAVPQVRAALIEQYARLGSSEIEEKLKRAFDGNGAEPVLMGVIHGDLHGTNVMVRGHDAIIVDLEKLNERGPLLLDVANLEAGLFIDGFVGDPRTGAELLASLTDLHTAAAFTYTHVDWDPHNASAWYYKCVRELRMHARQIERHPLQYAFVLARMFAAKACNDVDLRTTRLDGGLSRDDIRAIAMPIALRILSAIGAPS